jgi:hypothetical protein
MIELIAHSRIKGDTGAIPTHGHPATAAPKHGAGNNSAR